MSQELEKKIQELAARIEGLENRIEDAENRKPVVGPKGAPGDISAALHNVTEALPGLVKAEMARLKFTTLRGDPGLSGRDGESIKGPKGESGLTAHEGNGRDSGSHRNGGISAVRRVRRTRRTFTPFRYRTGIAKGSKVTRK